MHAFAVAVSAPYATGPEYNPGHFLNTVSEEEPCTKIEVSDIYSKQKRSCAIRDDFFFWRELPVKKSNSVARYTDLLVFIPIPIYRLQVPQITGFDHTPQACFSG